MGQFTRFPQSLQNRSTFCRRFPSVGERAMKATWFVASLVVVAAATTWTVSPLAQPSTGYEQPEGPTYEFRGVRPSMEVVTNEAVAVAVQDKRSYVLSGRKPETWAGLVRGRYGNPFDVTTKSKEPLASDISAAIVQTFLFHKVQAVQVRLSPTDPREEILSRLAKTGTPKALLITMDEWRTDTRASTKLDYSLRAELLDAAGKLVASNSVNGTDSFAGVVNASQALERRLGRLLTGPIVSALQSGAPVEVSVPAASTTGPLLLQQVHCKVGEAAPTPMTRLACSQRNGEVVSP